MPWHVTLFPARVARARPRASLLWCEPGFPKANLRRHAAAGHTRGQQSRSLVGPTPASIIGSARGPSTGRNNMAEAASVIGIIMGSQSDWETMQHAAQALERLGIAYETRIMSAHRTPDRLFQYAREAQARGLKAIIAGAGGAAHLPGVAAALTPLPVLGVPIESQSLRGLDSLLSIVQMPAGIPVATFAIGRAGAVNAALFAAAMLGLSDPAKAAAVDEWRRVQAAAIPDRPQAP